MPGDGEASLASHSGPSFRSLFPTIYLPALLFASGLGAVIPQIALTARGRGASLPMAGIAVALRALGTAAFDVPSGAIVARFGQRKALLIASGLFVVSLLGCMISDSVWAFSLWIFVLGCGWSVWLIAGITYISDVIPSQRRGRALSTMGGTLRIGMFIGPFAGAAAVALIGVDGAYLVHLILAAAAGVLIFFSFRDPHAGSWPVRRHVPLDLRGIGRRHMAVFLTGGIGILTLGALRTSREVILPLWAEFIGLDAVAVGVIFGISSAIDMTLFYPVGSISDRFGRKVVAVPCMTLLALGLMLVPLARGFWPLVAIGVLLGIGNGLGSGIVMTLGADFSPDQERAAFLGVWNLIGHLGSTGGPLIASAVAAISLAAAPLTVGAIGLAGAVLVLLKMPEPRRLDTEAA